jgi:hypothetical protein
MSMPLVKLNEGSSAKWFPRDEQMETLQNLPRKTLVLFDVLLAHINVQMCSAEVDQDVQGGHGLFAIINLGGGETQPPDTFTDQPLRGAWYAESVWLTRRRPPFTQDNNTNLFYALSFGGLPAVTPKTGQNNL